MKKLLMAGAAMGALVAGSAQAQVQTFGFYGYIDGMYALKTTTNNKEFALPGFAVAHSGDGWGVDGKLGYRFDGTPWDIALGGRYLDQSKGKAEGDTFGWRNTDGKYWNVDLEAGYTMSGPGWGVRPLLGVRYQNWKAEFTDQVAPLFQSTQKSYGVGPRIGVDGSLRIAESISLFGGIDTSFLFGKAKSSTVNYSAGGKKSRMFWDVGGKIGVDWEVAPLFHIAAGYKAEWFDGIHYETPANGAATGPAGRGGELIHGPFVRLTYNWGAPPSGPMAPKPPAATGKKSYIVFFDFDRALITPTAATTIKQAATDAKAGKSTRLDVTGHADKSGGDAYNMALSLRRGNAVKDQLVREGIPANQIAVVGRGESMPLVQTADGVREPQNRRVEIVLN